MPVAGILLGLGEGRRFGGDKLSAKLDGKRLVDIACGHFLDAGFDPVVFVGSNKPDDPRVIEVNPGAKTTAMIETLRLGLEALRVRGAGAFAFAPADMPALAPPLLRALRAAFENGGHEFLVPSFKFRRGHPAFARDATAFFSHGDAGGAREIWKAAGTRLHHEVVATADVLFDVDVPEDLAAAGSPESRHARLVERGDLDA